MQDVKLFGTDGIRGVTGKYPLDGKTVKIIGACAAKAFKKKVKRPLIAIGRDTRESGSGILKDLASSISASGVEVWDLGVIPTPGVAFIARKYPVSAAIVISASHNPYEDNGIKFFSHKGTKLPDRIESQIEGLIKRAGRVKTAPGAPGAKLKPLLLDEYKDFLKSCFTGKKGLGGLKLAIDCANGATSSIAPELFSSLGAEVACINCSPNGKNINKDCGSLHPERLAKEVARLGAYCGLAFDGDGDRIIFVDEKGVVRDGDYLLALGAVHLKSRGELRNNLLITTVMANLGLMRAMEQHGIEVRQTPVGDRYVFEEMIRSGSVIGGEQSGHIIFLEHLPTGDGMLSALQVLEIAVEKGVPFSKLCSIVEKYPQVLVNTRVAKKVPFEKLPAASALIADAAKRLGSDGRVLVRYSGTENLLRVMIEGKNKREISALAQKISDTAKNEIEIGK